MMNEPCTGCDKALVQAVNRVTVHRYSPTVERLIALGVRRNKQRATKDGYGDVFVGDGLCDSCAGQVMECVRIMWERVRQESRK